MRVMYSMNGEKSSEFNENFTAPAPLRAVARPGHSGRRLSFPVKAMRTAIRTTKTADPARSA